MSGKIYHPEDQHPEPYQSELNPDANKGQSHGAAQPGHWKAGTGRSAHDVKELHNLLTDLSNDELKRIALLPEGSRLRPGATYLDLHDPARSEFTGSADRSVGPGDWIVPKAEVDYPLWNQLTGVTNPDRLDQASR